MKIYLDIDGVLLANDESPALYAEELIDYLVNNHDVHWLTTHCKGDAVHTQQHLSQYFKDQKTLANLGKIRPTNWNTFKTEAIDFSEPFVWVDDDLFDSEYRELSKNNATDRVILVDLSKDPSSLLSIITKLQDGSRLEAVEPNLRWS